MIKSPLEGFQGRLMIRLALFACMLAAFVILPLKKGDTGVGYQPIQCAKPCEGIFGDWPQKTDCEDAATHQ
jgi:hypothetical protein